MTSSWRRNADEALPARGKIVGGYVNMAFQKSEAELNGFDEAIVLTADGHVNEASAANLFVVRDGVVPDAAGDRRHPRGRHPQGDDRAAAAPRASRSRSARSTAPSCTSPTRCSCAAPASRSRPVIEVDHRAVGSAQVGPIGRAIRTATSTRSAAACRSTEHWLTPIRGCLTTPRSRRDVGAASRRGTADVRARAHRPYGARSRPPSGGRGCPSRRHRPSRSRSRRRRSRARSSTGAPARPSSGCSRSSRAWSPGRSSSRRSSCPFRFPEVVAWFVLIVRLLLVLQGADADRRASSCRSLRIRRVDGDRLADAHLRPGRSARPGAELDRLDPARRDTRRRARAGAASGSRPRAAGASWPGSAMSGVTLERLLARRGRADPGPAPAVARRPHPDLHRALREAPRDRPRAGRGRLADASARWSRSSPARRTPRAARTWPGCARSSATRFLHFFHILDPLEPGIVVGKSSAMAFGGRWLYARARSSSGSTRRRSSSPTSTPTTGSIPSTSATCRTRS